MSYDLFFRPRSGEMSLEVFEKCFSKRSSYKIKGIQSWYENSDTGVYFSFTMQANDKNHPIAFNLNYFRPSYFGLEAEPEVHSFVEELNLTVDDLQTNGMGVGEYDSARFLSGWNAGNSFACAAILQKPENRSEIISYPSKTLIESWAWNRNVNKLQQRLGHARFVPKIMFLLLDGQPITAAVWPDGIPIAAPRVDYLIVPRKDLVPARASDKGEDRTILAWNDAEPFIRKYQSAGYDQFIVMNYDIPPEEVKTFVRSLPKNDKALKGVAPDKVLDRELVEKAVR